ncbi:MAG: DUF2812 domain-containing protein [Peptococcaceae bacterium]|nr:DUF2812 domain-containing protein [Peptococcaceae bacterium]
MKDRKRVLSKYSFYDRTHIQQYLEDMASKGWMLEKITSFYWQFKAIEPQTLHFSINYFPPASEFDAEPSEQLLTIRDYCAHAGWEFVTASAQMQIYCNAQENPTPIETDALVEVETIHKAMKKNFLPSQIVLLILGILQMILHVNMFRINPIGYFTNASNFVATFCWLVVIAMCSLEVFGYLRWYKKARHAAEVDGEFIETPSHRHIILSMLGAVMMVFLLWILTLQSRDMYFVVGVLTAGFVFIFWFTGVVMKWMKRKKVSAKVSRIATVAISFTCGFLLLVGAIFGMIHAINSDWFADDARQDTYEYQGHTFNVYHDELPLYIEDLMETDYTQYSTYWEGRETFLLGEYEAFQRPRMDALNEPSLRYDVYYIKWGALYDLCLNELIHQYDDRYEDDVPMEWRDNFRAVDAKAWNANIVYQKYTGDTPNEQYILCYDDIIVYLTPGFELTDAQKLIVSEKLNK